MPKRDDSLGLLQPVTLHVFWCALRAHVLLQNLLRGWFVGPELTVMRVNGAWYNIKDIGDDIRNDSHGGNLDELWVRKTR